VAECQYSRFPAGWRRAEIAPGGFDNASRSSAAIVSLWLQVGDVSFVVFLSAPIPEIILAREITDASRCVHIVLMTMLMLQHLSY